MTAKYRPDGFLYYSSNRWQANDEIISEGPLTTWNPASWDTFNGDGCLILPGPHGPLATQRLENIRAGMQDYEYYRLLRKLTEDKHSDGEVPEGVVKNLIAFTDDPEAVEAEKRRLAKRILENL